MRAVIQRVSKASVSIDGKIVGSINRGMVILLGIKMGDNEDNSKYLAEKCINLRIFADKQNRFNLSAKDLKGEFLVVSQFTLFADTRKGRRPSFVKAALPEISIPLYKKFISFLRQSGLKVACGIFGAMMSVEIHNDGPVTIIIDSK